MFMPTNKPLFQFGREQEMIIRVFRALVRDGKRDEFEEFFLEKAVPKVRLHPGLISVTIGTPLEDTPNEFMLTTVWNDMNAIKDFAGEHWQKAVIYPEAADLLSETFVHHYEGVAI
jgi:heme-degrading monooxygenase HmoA